MIDTRTLTIVTFGDSVLDSSRYSGTTAGEIVASGLNAKLLHLARDGATIYDIDRQWDAFLTHSSGILGDDLVAMVSVGGNDFLLSTNPFKWDDFAVRLSRFLGYLRKSKMKVLIANVYDPTFGNDAKDFLGIPESLRPEMRRAYAMMNNAIGAAAAAQGAKLVDLRTHFLKGDDSWFFNKIEPSKRGAEEVAKAFLEKM